MPVTMPAPRRLAVVDLPGGERVQLEERRARVDEPVDPLAREQLAARAVALDRLLAAAGRDLRGACAQLVDERLHARRAGARSRPCARPGSAEAPRQEPNRCGRTQLGHAVPVNRNRLHPLAAALVAAVAGRRGRDPRRRDERRRPHRPPLDGDPTTRPPAPVASLARRRSRSTARRSAGRARRSTLIVFEDPQCPFCRAVERRHAADRRRATTCSTGPAQARVSRHRRSSAPTPSRGCARSTRPARQNKLWKMVDALYARQGEREQRLDQRRGDRERCAGRRVRTPRALSPAADRSRERRS